MTFDDIVVGAEYVSAGRTITEADIVGFAGLSGDFNPLHMDEQWVRANTHYPGRIAHGLLVHAIGEGLACKEMMSWKILAFVETQRRMLLPVLVGDRLCQTYRITAKTASRKDSSRGIVEVEVAILNQNGKIVQSGYNKYLIGGKP
ncbi:MaoC family dehydratase N-terminal domain-containing protein [Ancylobacter sp. 6x-1]|uniref:MaoC family dehydratase N-terminal domain-containing protein n=1 Tax=Ancylobacter crimeensis TaxID=2579147 RepID=A0ABT0DE26_9HYPH|nr:MaoC family dehydratase N-terminal domain-containing protein [Ancylobacter crimeensis]